MLLVLNITIKFDIECILTATLNMFYSLSFVNSLYGFIQSETFNTDHNHRPR